MAAEVFPVARFDEYAKPCEPAIHVLRSVRLLYRGLLRKFSTSVSELNQGD